MRAELLLRGVTKLEKAYTIVQYLDSLRSNYNIKSFKSNSSVTKTSSSFQFTQFSSRKNDFKRKRSDDRRKPSEQTSFTFSTSTKYYRCQDYDHIAANYSSEMKITFINGVPTQTPESDDEEVTYHPDINKDDDSDYDQEGSDAECNYIQLAPSNYIPVVRCAFSQEKDDCRRTAIFHTFI